jgi:hypothetical protein
MKLIIQNFIDDDGNVSQFTDAKQFHHSVKLKAEDIKVVSGKAKPSEVAKDINRHLALASGKSVGYNR